MKKRAISVIIAASLLINNSSFAYAEEYAAAVDGTVFYDNTIEVELDGTNDISYVEDTFSKDGLDQTLELTSGDFSSLLIENPETGYEDYSGYEDLLIDEEEQTSEVADVEPLYEEDWNQEAEADLVLFENLEEDAKILAAETGEGTFSGIDGNISWYVENGILTLSGTGEMNDYGSPEEVPWYTDCVRDYIDAEEGLIKEIVIESGVTSIGSYAFYNCRHITNVSIPNTVASVGNYSFAGCASLLEVKLSANVTQLGDYSFSSCTRLESFEAGNPTIGTYVFYNCSNLKTITFATNAYWNIDYSCFLGCSSLEQINFKYRYN